MAELRHDPDDFEALFVDYHRRGFCVAVHVQGERAIDRVLDAVAASLKAHPREDHRHRLEHGALITKAQLLRAKALGVTVSFFVDHLYFYGEQLEQLVGAARLDRYMPLRSALEAGHRISIHTDNPATPIDPWRAIRTAITRTPRGGVEAIGPDQTLTVEEALLTVTRDAAWQLGMENEIGTLEVGKRADCIVLSENPLTLEPSRLTEIETRGAWIDGQPVDRRGMTLRKIGLGWRVIKGALGLGE
jgi:predicted amidohydrolase YtcJ